LHANARWFLELAGIFLIKGRLVQNGLANDTNLLCHLVLQINQIRMSGNSNDPSALTFSLFLTYLCGQHGSGLNSAEENFSHVRITDRASFCIKSKKLELLS
jgi:hypothetical protein